MKIGYFFASDPDQCHVRHSSEPNRILRQFVEAGCEDVIFYYSCRKNRSVKKGEEMARHLTRTLRRGDTVVIDSLFFDFGFRLSYFPSFARGLREKGIHLMSLRGNINTKKDGDLYLEHLCWYIENKINFTRSNTLEGMAWAEKLGRKGGRRRALPKDSLPSALAMVEKEKASVAKVAEKFKISKRTLYRYIKEHQSSAGVSNGS